MADTAKSDESRRNFIKIGAGAVAGAVVVGGATALYYNGVVGNKNSDISTLQSQLNAANSQVTSLNSQLTAAKSQAASLNSQLTAAKSQAASLQSQLTTETTNYNSAQASISTLNSKLNAANSQVTTLTSQLAAAKSQETSLQSQLTAATSQVTSLKGQLATATSTATAAESQITVTGLGVGYLVLNPQEAAEVEAICSSMLPTDSTGPGAATAGSSYFIDQQLAGGNYGYNAKFYMQGPFVQPNQSASVTVKATNGQMITYSGGTPTQVIGNPYYYQHPMNMREFWETGLNAFETYCNAAYGGNFENLSAANQASAIADCWANKPTGANWAIQANAGLSGVNFKPQAQQVVAPTPYDWISEVQELVWAGFVTDPIHGGNKNMVGWEFTGYNGQNEGNFYGEGYTTQQLMVMSTPIQLKPASLGQLQAANAAVAAGKES